MLFYLSLVLALLLVIILIFHISLEMNKVDQQVQGLTERVVQHYLDEKVGDIDTPIRK